MDQVNNLDIDFKVLGFKPDSLSSIYLKYFNVETIRDLLLMDEKLFDNNKSLRSKKKHIMDKVHSNGYTFLFEIDDNDKDNFEYINGHSFKNTSDYKSLIKSIKIENLSLINNSDLYNKSYLFNSVYDSDDYDYLKELNFMLNSVSSLPSKVSVYTLLNKIDNNFNNIFKMNNLFTINDLLLIGKKGLSNLRGVGKEKYNKIVKLIDNYDFYFIDDNVIDNDINVFNVVNNGISIFETDFYLNCEYNLDKEASFSKDNDVIRRTREEEK